MHVPRDGDTNLKTNKQKKERCVKGDEANFVNVFCIFFLISGSSQCSNDLSKVTWITFSMNLTG